MSQLKYSQWLLLLHQIPPTPAYFRSKVLRRLNQLGALAIKNSVYILPETDDNMEDLHWVRSEISEEGGEAWLFRAEALAGFTNAELETAFQNLRANDYEQLLHSANELLQSIRDPGQNANRHDLEWRKLNRRAEELRSIDFFHAPGRDELETLMDTIDQSLHGTARVAAPKPELTDLRGRTWVTRRGIKVDRIATSWLIRRFLDPAAVIRFVDPGRYTHAADEIRFDMFEGEFTHEGDLCTFEALLAYVGIDDRALKALAEIVHDIDLKEDRYQRPETAGIRAMIAGLAAMHDDDEQRLNDGSRIFEAAYQALKLAPKA